MQTLSLNDVVRQAVGLVAAEIRRHKVELRVELDDSMLEIQADRIQLQQVLVNFIVNALDVVCSGQVFKPLIVIRTFIDSDKVGLSVSDTGPGIAPDQLAHVFERFFTTKKEGMGLGLAISRTLIERHGGQVWAENNRDGGATFQLRLSPHAEPHPSSDEAATEAGTP